MDHTTTQLLDPHFTNLFPYGGEAWFVEEMNGSTGYTWRARPDNSGTYEIFEELHLVPNVDGATGVPGKVVFKLKGINKGNGSVIFELYPPGGKQPFKAITVTMKIE